ncbi:MAG: fibronectin type III domain-containing protein [Clostridia bacterium]|nr:fibronectin type III domain-containing protein [Clostridia bacterium]
MFRTSKRILYALLAMLVLLSGLLPVTGVQAYDYGDDYENTFDWAMPLELGHELQGRINYPFDNDVFRFTPSYSGEFTFKSTGISNLQGNLYDSGINGLAYGYDNYNNHNFFIDYYLEANQIYYISVSCSDWGTGDYGLIVEPANNEMPAAPTGLRIVSADQRSVILTWDTASDNSAEGYIIMRDGVEIGDTSATTFEDTLDLVPNSTYSYTIQAYNVSRRFSEESAPVQATIIVDNKAPTMPQSIEVTAATEKSVSLKWTPSTDNISNVIYDIYRNGVKVGGTPQTSYTDNGLTTDTVYTYTIKARDNVGNESEESSQVTVRTPKDTLAPSIPQNLVIYIYNNLYVSLQWGRSNDNITVAGYEIYRDGVMIGKTTGAANYTDLSILPATAYTYTVKAFDAAGNTSQESNTVVVTDDHSNGMEAATPIQVGSEATGKMNYLKDVDYFMFTTKSSGEYTFETKSDENPFIGLLDSNWREVPFGRERINGQYLYFHENLAANQTYYLYIQDRSDTPSPYSIKVSLNDKSIPTAPTNLISATVSETLVRLTWTASTDNVGVKGYEIYRDGLRLKAESSTASTIGSLMPGNTYTFMVKAFDEAGNVSEQSNMITVTTLPDTQAPTTPAALTASSVTETSTILSWAAPIDNVGTTGYQIYRDGVRIATTNKTTFTATRLIPGRTYIFTVKAYDLAGNVSEASNEASVTTLTDTQAPTAPVNLMASDVTATTVTLTWTASTDNAWLSGYVVYRDGVKIATITGTTYTATGLTAGRTYNFTVKAYDVVNNLSSESNIAAITIP